MRYFEQASVGNRKRRDEPGIGDFCVYGGGELFFHRKAQDALCRKFTVFDRIGERGRLRRIVCALSQALFLDGTEECAGHGDR